MKFTYRWNSYEDVEGEAFTNYLHTMASKGWLLTNVGTYLLSFSRIPPANIQFCSDFYTGKRTKHIPVDKDDTMVDYLQLCKDSGWIYVCMHGECLIFKSKEEEHPYPLISDENLSKHIFFKRTLFLRTLLFLLSLLVIYVFFTHQKSQLTRLMSFEVWLSYFIFGVFFPSMVLRFARYFVMLYQYLRPSYLGKNRGQRLQQIYHILYSFLQSVFWLFAIPLALFNLMSSHSPYLTLYSIYIYIGILVFLCMFLRDLWKHYVSFEKYKERYGNIFAMFVLGIGCIGVFACMQESTSLYQEREKGILWMDQENLRGGENKTYHTMSFYIQKGTVSEIRQNIALSQPSEDMQKYREEYLYSAIYEAWTKDQASIVFDTYLKQEAALHKEGSGHYVTSGVDQMLTLSSKESVLKDIAALDVQEWGIDEGYRFSEHEYIIRKGNVIAYYFYDGTSTAFFDGIKKAITEL